MRVIGLAFGEPSDSIGEVEASVVPLFFHLALVLLMGIWLEAHVAAWFQNVAKLLG
jgi:hydrogenase-4 component F